MDILTHTLTGVAAGTVAAAFARNSAREKAGILLLGALGGALPDLDAISLWTHFDSTIGAIFNLSRTGHEIYFSKLWYGHHGFMHSLAAAFLFTLIIGLALHALRHIPGRAEQLHFSKSLAVYRRHLAGFSAGYILALLQDMPTPSGVWGGIHFLWPAGFYTGGTGTIWWWNNYDLFLIVVIVVLLNLLLLLRPQRGKLKTPYFSAAIMLAGAALFLLQIHSREINFNYREYRPNPVNLEQKSLQIQREILGEELYQTLRYWDKKLPLHF